MQIDNVDVSHGTSVFPGTNVDVEVTATETSGGSGSVAAYCIVRASHLSNPVLFHCAIVGAGQSFTFDSICSICPGSEGFQMPDSNVTLTVEVGGANLDFGDCPDQADVGSDTDTQTVTITPDTVSADDFLLLCDPPSPQNIEFGESVTVSGQVSNGAPMDAIVDVVFEFVVDGSVVTTERISNFSAPNGQLPTAQTTLTPTEGGTGEVEMRVENVREA